MSYQQLNDRANQLAHYLIEQGVGPDTLVGICVERRPHMVVGILAILKAGGAYVPSDPAYAVARLRDTLNDANPLVLLADTAGLSALSDASEPGVLASQTMIQLDSDWLSVAQKDLGQLATHDPVVSHLGADHLAYVIYTSGSTGKPKGVMITHGSVVNYLSEIQRRFAGNVNGAVVSNSLVFDGVATTLYGVLFAGKKLLLVPSGANELTQLQGYLLASNEAYLFKVTPSHLTALSRALNGSIKSLEKHVVVSGGEALTHALVSQWQQALPNACFINHYPKILS